MTEPVTHDVTVKSDPNRLNPFRAECTCGWGSSRYARAAVADKHRARHVAAVAAGVWRQAGAAS